MIKNMVLIIDKSIERKYKKHIMFFNIYILADIKKFI